MKRGPMPRSSQKNNVVKMPTAEMHRASELTPDAIACRAYEIYVSRGGTHGHHIDDWLQAERELQVPSARPRARSAPVP
jgi:hypothetical protein